ncbi:MAG: hypothetical protein LQ340_001269 [Diploschistes diacapsis]|nr:MAG: hypothetical protein LQ340_001269 [Diploschistes diacapsis]
MEETHALSICQRNTAIGKLGPLTALNRTEEIRRNLQPEQNAVTTVTTLPNTVMSIYLDLSAINFFKLQDIDVVRMTGDAFAPEFNRLKNTEPTAEIGNEKTKGNLGPDGLTPSRLMLGGDYPEVNRTMVGILALKWLLSNDYNAFTMYQDPAAKLTQGSFTALRNMFREDLRNTEEVYALIVAITINDLGKDDSLWKEVQALQPPRKSQPNHDEIIYLAAQLGLVPLMSDFHDSSTCHLSIIRGLRLGSSLNFAQFAQAENVPASLLAIQCLQSDRHALKLKFLEILLDVAGAQGHLEARCCMTFTEPFYQTYAAMRHALFHLIEGTLSPRDAFDTVLRQRADMLTQAGFRQLLVEKAGDRALLRLFCMARTSLFEDAQLIDIAFSSLKDTELTALVDGLAVDGIDDGDAVIPYYAPSLFAVLFRQFQDLSAERATEAIAVTMRFLGRVFRGTKPLAGRPGRVIECDVRFAQDTLKSNAFINNPSILDDLVIPLEAYGDALDANSIASRLA